MSRKTYRTNLDEFSHLKSRTDWGKKLVEAFDRLGINRSNISNLQIEAWFDTDCKETVKMLKWFSQYVDENNVLTEYENYKYQNLCTQNELFSDKDYDAALLHLKNHKPNIFEYKENCLEIEYLEAELEMYEQEQHRLDEILNLNRNLDLKLTKELNKLDEDEIAYCVQKNKVHQECLQLSAKLVDAHKNLLSQINGFSRCINQYNVAESEFLLKLFAANSDKFCELMGLDLFFKKQYNFNLDLESKNENELDILKTRINNSMQAVIKSETSCEKLNAEINFLKSLNIHDFVRDMSYRSQILLEANIIAEELEIKNRYSELLKLTENKSENFVNKLKLDRLQNIIQCKQQELDHLKEVYSNVMQIMLRHVLLYLLINKEWKDINKTDLFFKKAHCYVTTTLRNCNLRINDMLKTINDYSSYQKLPLDQKLEIFAVQRKILSDEYDNSISLGDLMGNFRSELEKLEQQVFCADYLNHRKTTKVLEIQIADLKNCFANGPTSQITVLPREVYDCFEKMNSLINSQANALKLTVQLFNDSEKKLVESKWFKIRRQLWMLFLVEPKKLIAIMKQIETVSKQNVYSAELTGNL